MKIEVHGVVYVVDTQCSSNKCDTWLARSDDYFDNMIGDEPYCGEHFQERIFLGESLHKECVPF